MQFAIVEPQPARVGAPFFGPPMSGQLAISIGQHSDKGRKEVNQDFHGALTVAFMMAFVTTFGFTQEPDKVGMTIGNVGEARTLGYAAHGAAGMATLFIRGMLCNWMVSTGVVGAMISTTVPGKVIAMWMPILVFFYMVFEHSVVNMFLFPSGLMLHAKFSILDYLIWNEIPTVLGNLAGGLAFTGLTLYTTHVKTAPKRQRLAA